MATYSSTAWEIPWTEEPSGLLGRERVGHDSATKQQQQTTAPVSINNSFRELTLCCLKCLGGQMVEWKVCLLGNPNQARLQQYVNRELPDVQAGFRKGRGTRYQIANIRLNIEKAKEFQKNIYFCLIDYAKPLTVWITINCGKFWKRWEYQTTWPASWKTYMQVRKQQLELDMEQQTGSK